MSITPIPDLYHVKWYDGNTNKWHYGCVDRFSAASIQYYNDGQQVIVDDAITPTRYVINVDHLTGIPSSYSPQDEYHQYLDDEYRKARDFAESLPEGLHAGKMFRLPVGDGYAFYVVTKVNRKTVDIEWRGFSSDRWVDFRFGAGGREKREIIEALVRREDGMRRLFIAGPTANAGA
jgi:hypothetical protein